MSQRITSFAPHEYYHLYNRGNSRQIVFRDISDYTRFQNLLYLSNMNERVSVRDARHSGGVYEVVRGEPIVAIVAYCLMPNHFHILATPLVDGGITEFMQRVSTGYAMYFNRRYARTGSLFEGKFKAQHVSEDVYMKYLFSYIHLNPLKLKYLDWKERILHSEELAKEAEIYQFSSYQDHLFDMRNESMILSREHYPEYFIDMNDWRKEVLEWIKFDSKE